MLVLWLLGLQERVPDSPSPAPSLEDHRRPGSHPSSHRSSSVSSSPAHTESSSDRIRRSPRHVKKAHQCRFNVRCNISFAFPPPSSSDTPQRPVDEPRPARSVPQHPPWAQRGRPGPRHESWSSHTQKDPRWQRWDMFICSHTAGAFRNSGLNVALEWGLQAYNQVSTVSSDTDQKTSKTFRFWTILPNNHHREPFISC